YLGVGTAILRCPLPDGTVNVLRLTDTLHVPSFQDSLMSWRTLDSKGCEMRGSAGLISVLKDANTLLVAKKIGNSYFVLQDEESARSAHVDLSYPEWHAALGHPSAALPTF